MKQPIKWEGGDAPLPEGSEVVVWHRDGDVMAGRVGSGVATDWSIDDEQQHPGDIVAYLQLDDIDCGDIY